MPKLSTSIAPYIPLLLAAFLLGCGPTASTPPVAQSGVASSGAGNGTAKPPVVRPPAEPVRRPLPSGFEPREFPENPRTLGDLLDPEDREPADPGPGTAPTFEPVGEPREVDPARLLATGIRRLEGRHVTIFTDLAPASEVDELPRVFDAAVPQWCAYFKLDPAKAADWKITACLIGEKPAFEQAGLLPADLPPFLHGYQRGHEVWLYEQPTAYYRRHLLLHEGTHAFMVNLLGGAGPPWYMEGMAERLATHRWEQGMLEMRVNPEQSAGFDHWGRIKIIRDEVAANRGRPLEQILAYGPTAHRELSPYAWCWGAVMFFETHPRTAGPFAELQNRVEITGPEFHQEFTAVLGAHWQEISEDWQLFALEAEYGYDVPRAAVAHREAGPAPAGGVTINLAADRGWQSTGVLLEAGKKYRVQAAGRFRVHADPRPWESEAGGVTLRYYRGHPLGLLLGAIHDDANPLGGGITVLSKPVPVGRERSITPTTSGTLYLKVNDSPAELAENEGGLTVRITAVE